MEYNLLIQRNGFDGELASNELRLMARSLECPCPNNGRPATTFGNEHLGDGTSNGMRYKI